MRSGGGGGGGGEVTHTQHTLTGDDCQTNLCCSTLVTTTIVTMLLLMMMMMMMIVNDSELKISFVCVCVWFCSSDGHVDKRNQAMMSVDDAAISNESREQVEIHLE